MTDRAFRVLLDASAIIVYARGGGRSVGVGEIIAEVADERAVFGVPAAALVEAALTVVDPEPSGSACWPSRL